MRNSTVQEWLPEKNGGDPPDQTFRSLHLLVLSVGIAGLWLLCRPYQGIWHDGVLYAGQALKILYPEPFSNDLFFRFGSQDSYSGFSQVYAALISFIGVNLASQAGVVVCSFAFVLAAYVLFRPLLNNRFLLWAGLANLAVFTHFYGSNRAFSFTELFLTARNVSEPLALTALVFIYRNRPVSALIAFLLAAWMHPLTALPVAIAGWIFFSLRDPRFWWAALLAGISVIPAWMGIAPFTALFQSFDDEWLATIFHAYGFLHNWMWRDGFALIYDFTIPVFAFFLLREDARRLCLSIVLAALFGLAATFVFADVLHNVLLTQLQFWRALWLLRFFSLMLTPLVIVSLYRSSQSGHYAALLFFTATCTLTYVSSPIAVALGLALWYTGRKNPDFRLSTTIRYLLVFANVAALALASFRYLRVLPQLLEGIDSVEILLAARSIFFTPIAASLTACVLLFLIHRSRWTQAAVLACCLFALGMTTWNISPPLQIATDRGMETSSLAMRERIAPTQQVYWEEKGLAGPWLLLQRPAYFSEAQQSGLLFSRGTAIESIARSRNIAAITEQEALCRERRIRTKNFGDPCAYDLAALKESCRKAQGLDFLILRQEYPGLAEAKWEVPESVPPTVYYLYRCQRLLEDA